MSTILGIDPGTNVSGIVLLIDGKKIARAESIANGDVLKLLYNAPCDAIAVEMVASYGKPVGREVFETCLWIGRFVDRWSCYRGVRPEAELIERREIKLHLCGTDRGVNDAVIRQRLIDLLGAPGTKRNPGPTYGVTSHAWAALAVARTAEDRGVGREPF